MSITYEANLNCDGKDCKTRPLTAMILKNPEIAKNIALNMGKRNDWVIIENEHYCPDCAEIFKG